MSDSDGNQGPFAESIRKQCADERKEYLDDLREELDELRAPGSNELTAGQCMDAIKYIDPERNRRDREGYVKRGFGKEAQEILYLPEKGLKPSKLNQNATIPIDEFMATAASSVD